MFGANGVLTLSILLHFASYPNVDLSDLLACNLVASGLAVFIAMLMHSLFPMLKRVSRLRGLPSHPHKSAMKL
ncbi:hypothetical protein HSBAA_14870 [Vreelandella sulfidaeris]|uniref:Uncharacterized protein n=1 Tax=Vreelandella sulfidaeris TaxID=115553 RepID=A0A455U6S4_9GAMM|nr:hypothetical protein HSBAA_14870 [Halomonas sulfidaeris]